MAALGTPILGDGKYGGQSAFLPGAELAKRLHLHALSIALPGRPPLAAPLPRHMRDTCAALSLAAPPD
jgi:23S rRNA pseudouridine955/2504/2580 synthase